MIHLKQLLAEDKLKMRIPSDIKKLHKLFLKNGKQLYVVGGAVRDAILGKSPKDFDLTTDASPDEVMKIAKQGNFKNTDELMSAKKSINPIDIPAIEPKFFIENGKWRGLLPGEDGYEDH